jgi:8-oxo-dGTP diphosphatase
VPAAPVLVIGAAVVRHGRVLAARRTRPSEVAGRWELPGGKVEPGEDPSAAVVREVREELGCEIRVTGRLTGEQPVRPGCTLRVLRAELVAGEPVPHEHDVLRWLGPEELDDVPWLAPDLPFLPELRELLLDGERLEGGNVGGAVRVGGTVRRPVGPWTPAVHRLLDHLAARGLRHVPEVLGRDARGREVLTYLPGRVPEVDHEDLTDAQLVELTRWARDLHEAVADLPLDGPWRFFGVGSPTVVAHNDLAPYNVCFTGSRLTGVYDWDLAGPSTPLMELAQLAWTAVPLYRPLPPAAAARRLTAIARAYGGCTGRDVLDAVPARVRVAVDGIRAAAAAGDEGMRNLMRVGEPGRTEVALADLRARTPAIERALR